MRSSCCWRYRLVQGYAEYKFMKTELKEVAALKEREGSIVIPTGTITGRGGVASATTSGPLLAALQRWSNLLEEELTKVDRFTEAKVEELTIFISQLSRRCERLRDAADAPRAFAEADAIGQTIVQLDAFIQLNALCFDKIYKKADKLLGMSSRVWLLSRLQASSFMHVRVEGEWQSHQRGGACGRWLCLRLYNC